MSLDRPRVSIGLPVYNGERFLRESLESLLGQTYSDFELIISDNASTDDTPDICQAFAEKDPRIRYHRTEENAGCAANYARAFHLSSGEYFKWAAADDVCLPDHLSRCVEVLDRDPTVVLAYPRTRFINSEGRPLESLRDPGWDLRSDAPHERLRFVINARHWVNAIFGLIRARSLARTRLVASYPGGDYRLLGELSLLGKFVEIPEYLFLRRIHPQGSSQHVNERVWISHFYTGSQNRICLPVWNRAYDHFTTVIRSRLRISQKLSLVAALCRRMHWDRTGLLAELTAAANDCLRRLSA